VIAHTVHSRIERRLLINYRIDPDRVAALLPARFRPQLQLGWAVGGICLIRLGELRLPGFPKALGLSTENMAHRFAVEWDEQGEHKVGVYVTRRETNSRISALAGGKVFSGSYDLARFVVEDRQSRLRIEVSGNDANKLVSVTAHEAAELGGELFSSPEEALAFFRGSPRSFSPGQRRDSVDCVRLEAELVKACPARIEEMCSSFFDNEELFPPGSCFLDSGLVMRDIEARWSAEPRTKPAHRRAPRALSPGKEAAAR
jgi:hypothetical protein